MLDCTSGKQRLNSVWHIYFDIAHWWQALVSNSVELHDFEYRMGSSEVSLPMFHEALLWVEMVKPRREELLQFILLQKKVCGVRRSIAIH